MAAWKLSEMPSQDGKTFVITGANSGIGYHAAEELARRGAHVVLACRSAERGEQAVARLRAEVPDASVELMSLDLGSLDSVRGFAGQLRERHDRLDGLCNNAGLMAIPRALSADGFEMQFAVNHLGHFALSGLLFELLASSTPSRLVTVSSMTYRVGKIRFSDLQGERRYDAWQAYFQSKLSNLLFAYELQRRIAYRGLGVLSVACHPGYAATNLQQVAPTMTGSGLGKAIMGLGNTLLAQSALSGALPTLYALTSAELRGGEFVGPRGPGHMVGAPVVHRSSRVSHDEAVAAELWARSEELTGVRWLPNEGPATQAPRS